MLADWHNKHTSFLTIMIMFHYLLLETSTSLCSVRVTLYVHLKTSSKIQTLLYRKNLRTYFFKTKLFFITINDNKHYYYYIFINVWPLFVWTSQTITEATQTVNKEPKVVRRWSRLLVERRPCPISPSFPKTGQEVL